MSIDDPKLTAYALGELDEVERAEVEARLAADPALRAEVDAMRSTAAFLTTNLARRESPVLSPERRLVVEKRLDTPAPPASGRKEAVVPAKTPWSSIFGRMFDFGLVSGVVGIVAIAALNSTGSSVNSLVQKVASNLSTVGGNPPPVQASALAVAPAPEPSNSESYAVVPQNPFVHVHDQNLSTFSIDVDTASYSTIRRYLKQGARPPADAVRVEEMINYFPYDYPQPEAGQPLTVHAETASCPWTAGHRLVKIGVKGRDLTDGKRPASNLVFMVDVSGSMSEPSKLPLLKQALRLLVERLGENDRVSIVVYAGSSGLALPPTSGERRAAILQALDNLEGGGSTNGAEGIELAYRTAMESFRPGGVNRVILCTDGDFNVGKTSHDALLQLITEKAKTGVFLTVLGFGMGNTKDSTMEMLADKGNGNYAYIDDEKEAKKVLVEQCGGTLVTVAKDVKIQVEFNPARVQSYRLIGYENRMLAARDFNDDAKDAGELGAGHTVTALYEVVPVGAPDPAGSIDRSRYQPASPAPSPAAHTDELLLVKLRYKLPDMSQSEKVSFPVADSGREISTMSPDFKFAAAVAAFGMILRDSPDRGTATVASVLEWAAAGRGADAGGYRQEFIQLVEAARGLLGSGR